MPIQVYETPESRVWHGDAFELRLKVEGTTDDAEARWAVLGATPVIWDGRIRQAPVIEPDDGDLWDATVTYQPNRKSPEIGDMTLTWKTGGGTQHITQSLREVARYAPPGEVAPPSYGAIGARPDGTVEGVDILVPQFEWSEKYTVNPGMLTWAYAVTCAYLTRCVNNHGFRGFAPGEVQFRGSAAEVRLTGTVEQPELRADIQYEFAAEPNVVGRQIGDIEGIAAKGQEYIDVQYEQTDVPGSAKTRPRPVAVYVQQLYHEASFVPLGIGT